MINTDLGQVPINITEHIKKFRLFLIASWPYLDEIMEYHDWDEDMDFTEDWLDVNWKMLIEREVLEDKGVLSPLSVPLPDHFLNSEKDKFIIESRLSKHNLNKNITFNLSIFCRLRFFGFCTNLKDGGYGLYPSFDCADLVIDSSKEIITIPIALLDFYLVRFNEES